MEDVVITRPTKRSISFTSWRWNFAAALVCGTVLGSVLVLVSPFAIRALGSVHGFNWSRLSNIGQTYGAVSAVLVVLGLTGVTLTVYLQVQEVRHARLQTARERQHELILMAIEHPELLRALGPHGNLSSEKFKQATYLNLWVQFWLMLWQFNDIDEMELRHLAVVDLFSSDIGRESWRLFHSTRSSTAERSRRGKEFYAILGEEYGKIMASIAAAAQD